MERERIDVKGHPFYQQGYAEGYKDGFNKFIEEYQKLLTTSTPREIILKCNEFKDCPLKKGG